MDNHMKWIETYWSNNKWVRCVISEFHHGVKEVFTLLRCYVEFNGP
jgi:hypothetical protein